MYFPAGIPILLVVILIAWNTRQQRLLTTSPTAKR